MKRLILGVLLCFAFAAPAAAGEVEQDVISEQWNAAIEAETPAEQLAVADELYAIYFDTTAGSYCEQYAATAFVIVDTGAQMWAEAASDEPDEGFSQYLLATWSGLLPLFDEIDSIANRCLNEVN